MKWNNKKSRLPIEYQSVLICDKNSIFIGHLQKEGDKVYFVKEGESRELQEVDYWMYLPEIPENSLSTLVDNRDTKRMNEKINYKWETTTVKEAYQEQIELEKEIDEFLIDTNLPHPLVIALLEETKFRWLSLNRELRNSDSEDEDDGLYDDF